jgi:hypothetical protein
MIFHNNWQINIPRFRLPSHRVPVPGQPIWCPSATMLRTRFGASASRGEVGGSPRCRNSRPLGSPARENLPLITLRRRSTRVRPTAGISRGKCLCRTRRRACGQQGARCFTRDASRRRARPQIAVFAPRCAGMANLTIYASNRARSGWRLRRVSQIVETKCRIWLLGTPGMHQIAPPSSRLSDPVRPFCDGY